MSRRVRYFPRRYDNGVWVIRMVTEFSADGRPKVARDRKMEFRMERIRAAVPKPCFACDDNHIVKCEEFARVSHPEWYKFVGRRKVPVVRDFHWDCVPERMRPLVRFFRC